MIKNAQILIVEDENIVAKDIANRLEAFGYRITAIANSGEEAIRKAMGSPPDLILMDIRLKGRIDGIEAAKEIRTRLNIPDIPVVYLTAYADDSTIERAKDTEPSGYLLKPFGEKELFATIEMALYKHRSLEKKILENNEQEQRRIGQDLHDNLCQHLTGIELMSKVLEEKLSKKKLPEANEATKIRKLVSQGISYTRELMNSLYPIELEVHGLKPALEQLAKKIEKIFNISCRFKNDSPMQVEDIVVATHLYRITQEAVHNAIKHGKAKHISIDLTNADGENRLIIKNNGAKFLESAKNSQGMGLHIMESRARTIGASLSIRDDSQGGVVVICSFPNAVFKKVSPNK